MPASPRPEPSPRPESAGPAALSSARATSRSGPAPATVFRNVRPCGARRPVDLTVVDGVVTAEPAPHGAEVVDCGGGIALPTLVDAHIHPDKTAWGEPWASRKPASSLAEYTAEDVRLYRA
ncbi:amidohydrolase family protein [Streptomyces californicus]